MEFQEESRKKCVEESWKEPQKELLNESQKQSLEESQKEVLSKRELLEKGSLNKESFFLMNLRRNSSKISNTPKCNSEKTFEEISEGIRCPRISFRDSFWDFPRNLVQNSPREFSS